MVYLLIAALLMLMTVACLAFAGRAKSSVTAGDGALAIYKDQLTELTRDEEQGLISSTEAQSQKTEISRRMLQAARDAKAASPARANTMPWYLALTVPVLAGVIYWQLGSPLVADVPRAARLASAMANNDRVAQVAMVEEHLEKKPEDVTGWEVLQIEYQREGRFADAARALTNIMRIKGGTGTGYADLAELLTFANKGLVTSESAAAAREALKREPQNPKAMFYGGLALKQEGKKAEALALFRALSISAPADAPWLTAVNEEIAALQNASSSAPEIAVEQVEEGMGMSPEDRQKMIAGMVDGLEAKLDENENDLQGWLRLIRARAVMGERDKATTSLIKAREIFAKDASALAALADLANQAALQ
jgi:cytochrome c-type biogenesis protein CcmH